MREIPYLVSGTIAWAYLTLYFLQKAGENQLNLFLGLACAMMFMTTAVGILAEVLATAKKADLDDSEEPDDDRYAKRRRRVQ